MQQPQQTDSRKKFLIWCAALLSSLAILKLIPGRKKNPDHSAKETVKVLGQDGKLVEIDKRLLSSSMGKLSNEELQQWIKR